MTVTHSGSNKNFAAGWENVFSKGAKKKPATAKKVAAKSPKKSAKKKGKK